MEDYVKHKVKTQFEKFVRSAVKIVFIAILIFTFILLFGYVFMWLWNWLMPEIFGLTTLTYWQAIGLLIMAKLIFGGFEGQGPGKGGRKQRNRSPTKNKWSCKSDFSEWKNYDTFWAEEGEAAFKAYMERVNTEKKEST